MTPSPLPARQPIHRSPAQRPQRPLGVLLGAIALAAFALIPQDRLFWSHQSVGQSQSPWALGQTSSESCHAVLNADQRLSRAQLTQFTELAQATEQATVHEKIAPPYCRLSRAHQTNQREAYPLAFDPDTWFVVNYDQGTYTGYDFIFRK